MPVRKLVALLLTLLLVGSSCPVWAAVPAEDEVRELTLEECLQLAEERNESIKLAETSLGQAGIGLKEAKSQDKKLKEAEDEIDLTKKTIGLYPPEYHDTIRQALYEGERMLASFDVKLFKEMGLWATEEQHKLAKQGYDLAKTGVRLKVTQAYHDVFKAEKDIALAEAASKAAAEYARITDVQVKVGLATESQRITAQKTLADAMAAREGAAAIYEAKKTDLLKEVGLDFDTKVKLATPAIEDEEFDFDNLLETALDNNINVKSAKLQAEVSERKFNLTGRWYPSITYKYQKAEIEKDEGKTKLSDAERSVENSVRSSYNMFLAAKEQLPAAEQAIREAEENLRIAELKLKTGLGTRIEVLQARQKLTQAQSNLTDVRKNYALAAASLKAAQDGLVLLSSQGSQG